MATLALFCLLPSQPRVPVTLPTVRVVTSGWLAVISHLNPRSALPMPAGTTGCGAGLGPSEAGQARAAACAHPATKPGGPSLSSHHPHPIAAQLAPQRCGLDALLSTHCSRHFYRVPLRVARWGCCSGGAHSGSRTQPGLLHGLPGLAPCGGHIPLSPSLSPHRGVTALLRSPQGFNVWSSRSRSCHPQQTPSSHPAVPPLPPATVQPAWSSLRVMPGQGPIPRARSRLCSGAPAFSPALLKCHIPALLPQKGLLCCGSDSSTLSGSQPHLQAEVGGACASSALCHVGLPPSSVFPGSKLRLNPDLFFNAQTRESLLACDFSYF